ncbi:hypothetical protein [Peribacillus butanolivorans]|uniref:hypothetical protein n=1 Tax=Peribacillus butanolivorans TaxID=421767 RepID=UPI00382D5F8A
MKRISQIIGIIVLIIVCIGAWTLFGKNTTETDAIYLDIAKLEGNTFTTNGNFTGGAIKYSGYKYKIDGENMYLYINNRLLIGKSGDFLIKIKDENLQNVEKVYLQGQDKSDSYQIWPNQED